MLKFYNDVNVHTLIHNYILKWKLCLIEPLLSFLTAIIISNGI